MIMMQAPRVAWHDGAGGRRGVARLGGLRADWPGPNDACHGERRAETRVVPNSIIGCVGGWGREPRPSRSRRDRRGGGCRDEHDGLVV